MSDKNEILFDRVYAPVFVAELEKRGVAVKTVDQLGEMLKMAAVLKAHQEQQPAVDADLEFLKKASAGLEALSAKPVSVTEQILRDPAVVAALAK